MARILVVTSGLPSVVYGSVELARRLARAGHQVTFGGLPPVRALVEHHDLGFLPLDPGGYEQFLEADARAGALPRLRSLGRRRRQARDAMALDGFREAVRARRPDLVLVNGEMHGHIIAATATGVSLALLNSFVSIWRRPGIPPPHSRARPGVGWKGSRPGCASLWLVLRARKWARAAAQRVRQVGCDRRSIWGGLAREAGFDLGRETDDSQWLIPFTYRRLPVLSLHALEFEFPHRPPERVHYVGPMVLESRIDRPMEGDEGARLDAVLARHQGERGERRLVYAAFGSTLSADPDLLRRLLGVVAERPRWELVLSLGDRLAPGDLAPLPERVHAFSWLPQTRVLAQADVAVIHGGIGTVDECVLAGVPMLVYCGGETDMPGTTARVVHHEIGIAGDGRRDGTANMRGHVDRLLGEERFGTRVRRLQERYRTYRVERVAERVVEQLLDPGSGTGPPRRRPSSGGVR